MLTAFKDYLKKAQYPIARNFVLFRGAEAIGGLMYSFRSQDFENIPQNMLLWAAGGAITGAFMGLAMPAVNAIPDDLPELDVRNE